MKRILFIILLLVSVAINAQEFWDYRSINVTTTGTPGVAEDINLLSDADFIYVFTVGVGQIALGANWDIKPTDPGTPGQVIRILYDGYIAPGVHTFEIMDQEFTNVQCGLTERNQIYIEAVWVSRWMVYMFQSLDPGVGWIEDPMIVDGAILTAAIEDEAVTLAKLEDLTLGNILIGSGMNRPEEQTITGDIGLNISGVTNIVGYAIHNSHINNSAAIAYGKLALTGAILNADLAGSVALDKLATLAVSMAVVTDGTGEITTDAGVDVTELGHLDGVTGPIQAQLDDRTDLTLTNTYVYVGDGSNDAAGVDMTGDIDIDNTGVTTIQSGAVESTMILDGTIIPSNLSTDLQTEMITFTLSFETGYTGTQNYKIKIPYDANLIYIYTCVTKAIEATNVAEIYFQDNAGNNVAGSGLVAGILTIAAASVQGTVDEAEPNSINVFVAGNILQISSKKTNAGGEVIVTLIFERQD